MDWILHSCRDCGERDDELSGLVGFSSGGSVLPVSCFTFASYGNLVNVNRIPFLSALVYAYVVFNRTSRLTWGDLEANGENEPLLTSSVGVKNMP